MVGLWLIGLLWLVAIGLASAILALLTHPTLIRGSANAYLRRDTLKPK